ncbi:MAG: ABC transporter ATP-binding protein, partial [Acidobacteriaceae bacterium]
MAIRPAWVGAGTRGGRKSESAGGHAALNRPENKKKPELRKVLPEIWALVRPRRRLLGFGLLLMVISRIASFVLPLSAKFLIDNVMHHGQLHLLPKIIGAVLLATAIQGAASYGLTQLLSIAAQRLIADLRVQVQQHIGRLPVAFYDANRTGTLVARIMTDVEGVRNLIGTGMVNFIGGL